MPFVEPTAVHQTRQSSNRGGNETQNNNVETSKPSTSTNDNPDGVSSSSLGQSQQMGNNQSVNVNSGYIQNRPQGKNIIL